MWMSRKRSAPESTASYSSSTTVSPALVQTDRSRLHYRIEEVVLGLLGLVDRAHGVAELLGISAFAHSVDTHDAPDVSAQPRASAAVDRQRIDPVVVQALADIQQLLQQAQEPLLVLLVDLIGRRRELLAKVGAELELELALLQLPAHDAGLLGRAAHGHCLSVDHGLSEAPACVFCRLRARVLCCRYQAMISRPLPGFQMTFRALKLATYIYARLLPDSEFWFLNSGFI